jgi:UPF0271 protein
MARCIDVNADVGEGFAYDRDLLDFVTSANVACGFHAGDDVTMRRLCRWCGDLGVAVGAQVSYRDRENFGRRRMDVRYGDLRRDVQEQVEALSSAAEEASIAVSYLKPHGALYNRVVSDVDQARAVVDAAAGAGLPVLGLPGSALLAGASAAGLPVAREFFADRGYTDRGTLVSRSDPGALVSDPAEVSERVARFVEIGTVVPVSGAPVQLMAESICVHGDTPGAVAIARAVVDTLAEHGVARRAFRAGAPR